MIHYILHFKDAWYSYLSLLDISYFEGFSCLECGSQPDVIICDGTSLSLMCRFVVKGPEEKESEPMKEPEKGR